MSGSRRAWDGNDGDAFAESLAEAKRLAVLDMPERLEAAEEAGEAVEESVARTVELLREGDLAAARANRLRDRCRRSRRSSRATRPSRRSRRSSARRPRWAPPRPPPAASALIIIVALVALLARGRVRLPRSSRGITRSVALILERLRSLRDNDTTDLARRAGRGRRRRPDASRHAGDDRDREPGRRRDRPAWPRPSTRSSTTPPRSIAAYNEMRTQLAEARRRAVRERRHGVVGVAADGHDLGGGRSRGRRDRLGRQRRRQGAERQVRMVESTRTAVKEASRAASSSAETRGGHRRGGRRSARRRGRVTASSAAEHASRGDPPGRRRSSEQVGDAIGELSERSERIGGIVDTITGDRRADEPAGAQRRDRGRPRRRAGPRLRRRRRGGPQAGRGVPGRRRPDRRAGRRDPDRDRPRGRRSRRQRRSAPTRASRPSSARARRSRRSATAVEDDERARRGDRRRRRADRGRGRARRAGRRRGRGGRRAVVGVGRSRCPPRTQQTGASTQEIAASAQSLAATAAQLNGAGRAASRSLKNESVAQRCSTRQRAARCSGRRRGRGSRDHDGYWLRLGLRATFAPARAGPARVAPGARERVEVRLAASPASPACRARRRGDRSGTAAPAAGRAAAPRRARAAA